MSENEWASRSFDSILAPKGYAVLRAFNGRQALDRARASNPDAVFIDSHLPDIDGEDLCRQMVAGDVVSRATPLIIFGSTHTTREHRLRALEAGAWELLTLPLDAEELLLRLGRYMRAKLETDRVREDGLIDAQTGLYSWEGIVRRVRELGSAASRFHRPMACVAFTSEEPQEARSAEEEVPVSLAAALRTATRASDVLGRIGPLEFVVLAPDTDAEGASILAERLRQATGAGGHSELPHIRTGVYGVNDLHEANLDPTELLIRATMAARTRLPLDSNG